jgi:hypothetical protein
MNMLEEPLHCFPQGCQGYPSKRLVPQEEGGDSNYLDIQKLPIQIPLSPQIQ